MTAPYQTQTAQPYATRVQRVYDRFDRAVEAGDSKAAAAASKALLRHDAAGRDLDIIILDDPNAETA